MYRTFALSLVTLAGLLLGTQTAQAEVFLRLPFIRVEVGGPGVYVHAPFVNVWVPHDAPIYQAVPPPATPPPPVMPPADNLPPPKPLPPPNNVIPPPALPAPAQTGQQTLAEFAKTFQPHAGHFDVTIVNPVNKQPTQVHFTLPEGSPRRVIVDRDEIEFRYSLRQWVRIQFDADGGVIVTTR